MTMDHARKKTGGVRIDANSRQVGGDHYQTGGMQHWDLFGPEGMVYAATKYIARHRRKNGVEDLEKSRHYAEKLLEIVVRTKCGFPALPSTSMEVDVWAPNQGLTWVETTIIKRLMFYAGPGDIKEAIRGIEYLIQTAKSRPEEKTLEHIAGLPLLPPISDYTDLSRYDLEHLRAEVTRLQEANGMAPGWGAAVGAREESIREVHSEIVRRERRVPRHDADESRHSSLFPWSMTRDKWSSTFTGRTTIAEQFYRRMGASDMVLEETVECQEMPRELNPCYDLHGSFWVLALRNAPSELREMFARLPKETNQKEHEDMPPWQRVLYKWHEAELKWRLLPTNEAWGKQS